jgi:hypothetical protein
MANFLVQAPFEFFTDKTGRPLASGYLYIGYQNQDPERFPQPVYFDEDGTVAAPNPIRTNVAGYPADSAGNPQRLYVSGNYSIRVRDSNQNQVFLALDASDGFYGVVASDLANNTDPTKGSDLVGYVLATGRTGTTVHDKFERTVVDIKDFGAVGNGTTNDKAAFDAAASTGRSILLPAGNYNVPSGNYGNTRFYSFDGATCTNGTVAIVDPLASSLSVGTEVTFPCTPANLPFGWVALDGGALNRSVYPQLWAFANGSGNIVDEVDKSSNPGAFGRGNGTSTFSLPDKRGTNQGYADASRGLDTSFVLGKLVTVTAASAASGISVRSTISTPAIRAFAGVVNQGSIDVQALQAQVTTLTSQLLKRGTAQATTSGTAVDFTGIPAGVKQITVVIDGVSTNGTSNYQIQLGSGSIDATGYGSSASSGGVAATSTTGFIAVMNITAANTHAAVLTLINVSGNSWVMSGSSGGAGASLIGSVVSGNKTIGGVLDRVRITTASGADTFDAGQVNILWEIGS